jgi:hypothetical protein
MDRWEGARRAARGAAGVSAVNTTVLNPVSGAPGIPETVFPTHGPPIELREGPWVGKRTARARLRQHHPRDRTTPVSPPDGVRRPCARIGLASGRFGG